MITVEDIKKIAFTASPEIGYNPTQVDAFIDEVEKTIESLTEQNESLKSQLQAAGGDANGMFPVSATERQISAALITAQRTADTIVDTANKQAESIVNDANEKGEAIMRAVLAEKKKELDEIDRLRESRNRFRAEYVESEVDTIVGETPDEPVFPSLD